MTAVNAEMSVFDGLKTKNIPVLAPGAPYLLQSLADETIEFCKLALIIERFPSIAARLISLANSPWSSPVKNITSLELACSRLGFSVVRSTSIALAVASPFNPNRCPGFSAEYFWTNALMTADAASQLATEASAGNCTDPSTARAAGLLRNLGLLWLADQVPDAVDQAFAQTSGSHSNSLGATLSEIVGFTHSEAGGYLGNAWTLPEPLITAMAHHAESNFQGNHWETASLVGLAASMVSAVQQDVSWPDSDSRIGRLRIDTSAADKIFCRLNLQLEKIRDLARTLFNR